MCHGLAANPEALPKRTEADFDADKCAPKRKSARLNSVAWVAPSRVTLTGNVYNLVQPPGLPLEFGIHVEVPLVANEHLPEGARRLVLRLPRVL
jgi:hypothetical protein